MSDASDDPRPDPGSDLPPGTEIGGYVVDAKIGEGGMGVVYGAKQPRIGKRVAIKILARAYCGDPGVVARFENEARVVNQIKHPNIVDVFQFGELPDKRSYFVMEWLDGEPLTARIDRGAIPADEAIEILDVICDALQAAHEHDVIHRDLKSDNIFLCTSRGKRTVKLLDFGLAKLSGRGLEEMPAGSTKDGIVVGTPAYMSPEQARSQPVDARTDVYALGVLAYKMVTGTLPFRAANAMDLIIQQLNMPPPQPIKLAPKMPPALSKLIVKMMAKAPADRPSITQIREVFAELRENSEPVRAKRESVRAKRESLARTKRPTKDQEPIEERQEPSMGKARLSLTDLDARPDDEPAQRKHRATGVLIFAAILLVGLIGMGVFLLVNKSESTPETASVTPGSATLQGSAGSAGSAVAPTGPDVPVAVAPTIEFEDDKVAKTGSARSASPSRSDGSTRKSQREDDDKATEELMAEQASAITTKPGRLIIMLQHPATIEIDGTAVAKASRGGTFEVTHGDHQIRVVAAGRQTVTRTVGVEPGGSAVIRIVDDTGSAAGGRGSAEPTPTPPTPTPPTPTPTPTPPPAPPAGAGSAAQ